MTSTESPDDRPTSRKASEISPERLKSGELEGGLLSGANLAGWDGRGARLRGADLSRANLVGADLSNADLSGADLRWSRLSGAKLVAADLTGARLSRTSASEADFTEAKMVRADCSDGNFRSGIFDRATLDRADFTRADLRGGRFQATTLTGTVLRRADHAESRWADAVMDGADISEASFHFSEWKSCRLERLQAKDALWSASRMEDVRFLDGDLRLNEFNKIRLRDVSYTGCDLSEARFTDSRHQNVVFQGCRLSGTELKGATVVTDDRKEGPLATSPLASLLARLQRLWRKAQTVIVLACLAITALAVVIALRQEKAAEGVPNDSNPAVNLASDERPVFRPGKEPLTIRTRILCSGGSHTLGTGAPADLSYPMQLAALLNRDHPDHGYAVDIQGSGGINSSMAVNRILETIQKDGTQPGIVIFNAGKDNEHNIQEATFFPQKLRIAPFSDQLRHLSEQADSLKLGLTTRARIEDLIATGKPQADLGWDSLFDVAGEAEQRFLEDWIFQDLQRLATELSKRKIALVLLNTWNPIGYVDRAFERARDNLGAVFVDAANFGNLPRNDPPSKTLLNDDGHPNQYGYAKIADLVSRALFERGLAGPPVEQTAPPN